MAVRTWKKFKMNGEISSFVARVGALFIGFHGAYNPSTVEAELMHKSIPANTLALNNAVHIRTFGTTIGGSTITLRFWLDNDVIYTIGPSIPTAGVWIVEHQFFVYSETIIQTYTWGHYNGVALIPTAPAIARSYHTEIGYYVTVEAADAEVIGLDWTTATVNGYPNN